MGGGRGGRESGKERREGEAGAGERELGEENERDGQERKEGVVG